MGQFYKGAEATFIDDAMYKPPYELMAAVIDKKDKAIDDTILQYQGYLDKLKEDVLEQDSPELRATIQQYQTRIDNAVQGITNDPMNYQKYTPELNTLGRDITNDWSSTGKVGTMAGYKKKVLAEYEALDKLAKEKGLEADYIAGEKQAILAKYKGVEWNKETGKAMGAPEFASAYHKLDFDEGFLNHLKAQKISRTQDRVGGPWVYRHEGSTEILSPNDIISAYMLQANADPATQAALARRNQLGQKGFESVGLNEVYIKVPETDKEGKPIIENGQPKMKEVLNPNNYWAKKMGAAAETYDVNNSDTKDTQSENSVYARNATWAREDEKERRDNITAETVDETSIVTRDATAGELGRNFTASHAKVSTTINTALDIATKLGIKAGSTAYNQIKNGNFTALRAAGKKEEGFSATVDQLDKSYKRANAEKGLAQASLNAFTATLPANLQKLMYAKGSAVTWYKNKTLVDAYTAYTTKEKGKGNFLQVNLENQITSLNDANMSKGEKDSFKNVIVDDIDKFRLKFSGIQGKEQILQTAKGTNIAFTDNKNLNGKTGKRAGVNVTFVYSPTGDHSIAELQKIGVIGTSVGTTGTGKNKKYVYYENGAAIGIDVAESTFGIVKGLDSQGKGNMGVHIQLGQNTIRATLGTDQVSSPNVRNWFSTNDDNLYFENQNSKTNWGVIDKEVRPGDGNVYRMQNGKAFMNGVQRTDAAGIKIVKQIVMEL